MNVRSNQRTFRSYLPMSIFFLQAFALLVNLNHKENFCQKISLKRGHCFDHNNWYVNNMAKPFSPTAIETRTDFAKIGFVNNHHFVPYLNNLVYPPTYAGKLMSKKSKDEFNKIAIALLLFEAEISFIIHGSIPGSQRQQITFGRTVQDIIQHMNVMHTLGLSLQITNLTPILI